jgi:hypothetical protein
MLDRAACERRVYRLATLLTGNPVVAARVIAEVVDAQPDLRRLDPAHLDRLTVLRSREIAPAALADELVPRAAADALAGLTAQQREAWIFARVYRHDMREMARAMDCSTTATRNHLARAEEAMGRAEGTAESILRYSMSLDVPEFFRARRRKRRTVRLVLRLALLAVILIVLAVAYFWGRNAYLRWTKSPDAQAESTTP